VEGVCSWGGTASLLAISYAIWESIVRSPSGVWADCGAPSQNWIWCILVEKSGTWRLQMLKMIAWLY